MGFGACKAASAYQPSSFGSTEGKVTCVIKPSSVSAQPADLEIFLDLLRARGYLIFENLAAPDTIESVCRELEPWLATTPHCQGDFYGWNTTRVGAVLLKSVASHALALDELMLALVGELLTPQCDWYQLSLSQAVRIHPGERQQVPHRDEEMWPCAKNGVEYLINVMWALSDFTEENGATWVWPRSHFRPFDRTVAPERKIVAHMPRGSALMYLGSVTHCAGPNRSARPRTGLTFSYCLGWLKQSENAFLAYPPEVAKDFPRQLQQLIGYRIHRPNLGGYEGQDPSVLFTTTSHQLAAVDALPPDTAAELAAFYGQIDSTEGG
jgi:ectoine hydroxylase-related dioxygenase (phytanoyl-CoA dioxygenase family)